MKVLFIGNSYTYYNDMPLIFASLAEGNGHPMITHQVTKGGWHLKGYLDTQDEFHLKLLGLIQENRYDYCFLQEQSLCPILDYDLFSCGAKALWERLQSVVGECILYETWARKEGHPALKKYSLTVDGMAESLIQAYEKLGRDMGIRVSPAGRAFRSTRKNLPDVELFNEDLTHPSYAGSCVAAICHYTTIFGEFPENTQMLDLPQGLIDHLRGLLTQC